MTPEFVRTVIQEYNPSRLMVAAMMMQGILANGGEFSEGSENEGVEMALRHADALLKAEKESRWA